MPCSFIWDLDGTLVDSYAYIVPAVRDFCRELGLDYSGDYIRNYILRYSVSRLFDQVAEKTGGDPEWMKQQYDYLNNRRISGIRPMPHAREVLAELTGKGHQCFVYTHRGASCDEILNNTGLAPFFREVVTSLAGFPRKPAPDGILYLIDRYQLRPEDCYYVGDRSLDVESGLRAGIGTILLLTEGSPVVPSGLESFVIHDLSEICRLF